MPPRLIGARRHRAVIFHLAVPMTFKPIKSLAFGFLFFYVVSAFALQLKSEHAIVISNDTGAVLLDKNAADSVPIASLTKFMTVMVVLDSKPDMNEKIAIDGADVEPTYRRACQLYHLPSARARLEFIEQVNRSIREEALDGQAFRAFFFRQAPSKDGSMSNNQSPDQGANAIHPS